MSSNQEAREKLRKEIFLHLGGGMVDIELDPEHYEAAIDQALTRYRYRSSNAVEESWLFLTLQPEQTVYTLPNEIIEIRQILRRGVSGGVSGGAAVDPFSLAYTNAYIMNMQANQGGSLATYDFAQQALETIGRLFGRDINYTWNPTAHKLTIMRRILDDETVLLWCYNYRPDFVLLSDPYSKNWLFNYSLALCKRMLGQARSKFASIAGPQGGTTLNGSDLISQADAELERLEEEVKTQTDQNAGYGFIIG